MYTTSTQKHDWTFQSQSELDELRHETNKNYVNAHPHHPEYLTVEEELQVIQHYDRLLREFCCKFQPAMPKPVMGTACAYLKRCFIQNSVMDIHPDDFYLTCVYVACKIEEFNVSVDQFVGNVEFSERARVGEEVLSQELNLMQVLNFHLTIHNPFRPLEGLLIAVKRHGSLKDVEVLRKRADDFLFWSLATDVSLIYPPSKIALAGLQYSSLKNGVSLTKFLEDMFLESAGAERLKVTLEVVDKIVRQVKSLRPPDSRAVKSLLVKLDVCRNQELNPKSQIFKRKLEQQMEDDDERITEKRRKITEQEKDAEHKLLHG